mgnify:CR=1 FL=1
MNNKTDLNDRYNPSEFEEKIYKLWESSGAFKVRIDKSKKAMLFQCHHLMLQESCIWGMVYRILSRIFILDIRG